MSDIFVNKSLFLINFLCCISAMSLVNKYEEKYYNQTIDHFSFFVNDLNINYFQQRYLIQDKWWEKGNGPIFFYTGNEGDIVEFWNNTGFMMDIAPQFHALIVFAEHRYYGKSLPFGPTKSFQMPYAGYLTVEQTMADFAVLIDHLKTSLNASNCPVIAFGGSYGGMLSAYMRFKYPNLVDGALSASAPIYLVGLNVDRDFFFKHVSKDFHDAGCDTDVKKAFAMIQDLANTGNPGLKTISTHFHLCETLSDLKSYRHMLLWIRNVFTTLAMMDYPYPSEMLTPLPAYPVKEACKRLTNESNPIDGMFKIVELMYGEKKCHDISEEFVECADPTGCGGSLAWSYQSCAEMLMPAGTNNVTDMFPVLPFTVQERKEYCQQRWGLTPRDHWFSISMWGNQLQTTSNIVFSNGDLDPWREGGVLTNVSDSVVALEIKGGAHHLDLRSSNKEDPPSVKAVRKTEIQHISKWIKEARMRISK